MQVDAEVVDCLKVYAEKGLRGLEVWYVIIEVWYLIIDI